ncbi:MAG: RNA polymerase sigma factor [Pirellulaceae bacterium]
MNAGPVSNSSKRASFVDDENLMVHVRDHDNAAAFGELVQRWQIRVHRMCFRMTGDWQDAEDLTQEVFAKLYRSRDRYVVQSALGTFLWQIALNHTRDFVRKSGRTRQQQLQLRDEYRQRDGQKRDNHEPDDADEVQKALLQLPDHYREVVVLRHFENLKFRQIADLLQIPEGTVASRMAKALRLLEQTLRPQITCEDTQ